MAKLSKTSIQLSPETLKWLDSWPGMTKSEAIRLALERAEYLQSQMGHVVDLALKYHGILTPALQEFQCVNYRTVARALPSIVQGFVREMDYESGDWKDDDGSALDPRELIATLGKWSPAERIHLLDCIVARRGWPEEQELDAGRPKQAPPA